MAWTPGGIRAERPVLVRTEVHDAGDHQQAPVGDRRADQRGQTREQTDTDKQARAPGNMEPAPPTPTSDPRTRDAPPPCEVAVGHKVELQGCNRLHSVGTAAAHPRARSSFSK